MAKIGTAYIEVDADLTPFRRSMQQLRTESAKVGVEAAIDRVSFDQAQLRTNELGGTQEVDVKANVDAPSFAKARVQSRALGNNMNGLGNGITKTNSKFQLLRNSMELIKWPAIIGGAGQAAGAISALGGGAVALVGALAPSIGLLTQYVSVLGSLGQSVGVFKLAFSGIGDAVGEMSKAQQTAGTTAKQSADAQRQAAEQVISAQQGLADSHRQVELAQESLTQAQEDARREMIDLKFAAEDAALSQKRAALSLREARRHLAEVQKDPTATMIEQRDAALSVQEAEQQLAESRVANNRAQKDSNEAQQKGIRGSDQVVAAQRAVADAQRGVATASRALADAQRSSADAMSNTGSAATALAQKMAQLPAVAQQFAKFLFSLKPKLDTLRETAAKGLLPGAEEGLRSAINLFPRLDKAVGDTAKTLGGLSARFGSFIGSKGFGRDFSKITETNRKTIGRLGSGVINLAHAFTDIMVAARPLTNFFSKMILGWTETARAQAQAGRASGALGNFFKDTEQVTKRLVSITTSFGSALMNIISLGKPLGDSILKSLDRSAQSFQDWTESAKGKNTIAQYFKDIRPVLFETGRLMRDLTKALFDISEQPALSGLIKKIRVELLPVLTEMVNETSKAFGPAVIRLLTDIAILFSHIGGAAAPLTVFTKALDQMIVALTWLLDNVPGLNHGLVVLLEFAAINKAFKFAGAVTGISALIKGFTTLRTAAVAATVAETAALSTAGGGIAAGAGKAATGGIFARAVAGFAGGGGVAGAAAASPVGAGLAAVGIGLAAGTAAGKLVKSFIPAAKKTVTWQKMMRESASNLNKAWNNSMEASERATRSNTRLNKAQAHAHRVADALRKAEQHLQRVRDKYPENSKQVTRAERRVIDLKHKDAEATKAVNKAERLRGVQRQIEKIRLEQLVQSEKRRISDLKDERSRLKQNAQSLIQYLKHLKKQPGQEEEIARVRKRLLNIGEKISGNQDELTRRNRQLNETYRTSAREIGGRFTGKLRLITTAFGNFNTKLGKTQSLLQGINRESSKFNPPKIQEGGATGRFRPPGGHRGGLVTPQGIIPVQGFQGGGLVGSTGLHPKDKIPAMLEVGELVIPKKMVDEAKKNAKKTRVGFTGELGKGYKEVRDDAADLVKDHDDKFKQLRANAVEQTTKLRKATTDDFTQTSRDGTSLADKLKNAVTDRYKKMKSQTTQSTQSMQKGVIGDFKRMNTGVGQGINKLAKMTNNALDALGVKKVDFGIKVDNKKDGGQALARGGLASIVPGQVPGDRHTLSVGGVPIAKVESREGIFVGNRSMMERLDAMNQAVPRRAQGGPAAHIRGEPAWHGQGETYQRFMNWWWRKSDSYRSHHRREALFPDYVKRQHEPLGTTQGMIRRLGGLVRLPGFAGGGGFQFASVPGFPGEEANVNIIDALVAFAKEWKLFLTDAYDRDHSAGHVSDEHNVSGTAADFVPGPGGSWGLVGRAAEDAVKKGYTPVGYDGRDGTEAWSGHGPPGSATAGGTPHVHITFETMAEATSGKVLSAAGGTAAAVEKIKRVLLKGPDGPLKDMGQAALDKVRNAANKYIESKSGAAGGFIPGGGPLVRAVGEIIQKAGGSKSTAAAILGNAWQESTWSTHAGDLPGGAGGLWGFTTGSKGPAALSAYAAKQKGSIFDVAIQTNFMLTTARPLLSRLNNESLSAATADFMTNWEAPLVSTQNLPRRLQGAEMAMRQLKEGGFLGAFHGGGIVPHDGMGLLEGGELVLPKLAEGSRGVAARKHQIKELREYLEQTPLSTGQERRLERLQKIKPKDLTKKEAAKLKRLEQLDRIKIDFTKKEAAHLRYLNRIRHGEDRQDLRRQLEHARHDQRADRKLMEKLKRKDEAGKLSAKEQDRLKKVEDRMERRKMSIHRLRENVHGHLTKAQRHEAAKLRLEKKRAELQTRIQTRLTKQEELLQDFKEFKKDMRAYLKRERVVVLNGKVVGKELADPVGHELGVKYRQRARNAAASVPGRAGSL